MSSQGESDKTPGIEKRCEFGKSTRRTFQSRLEMASLSASASPVGPVLGERPKKEQSLSSESKNAIPVTLRVNGKKYDLRIDPRTTLLDCLREHLHLTGSKKGCDHGQCGACTVHINGRRVNFVSLLSPRCTRAMRSRRSKASVSRKICIRCRLRFVDMRCLSMRLLHIRPDHVGGGAC